MKPTLTSAEQKIHQHSGKLSFLEFKPHWAQLTCWPSCFKDLECGFCMLALSPMTSLQESKISKKNIRIADVFKHPCRWFIPRQLEIGISLEESSPHLRDSLKPTMVGCHLIDQRHFCAKCTVKAAYLDFPTNYMLNYILNILTKCEQVTGI